MTDTPALYDQEAENNNKLAQNLLERLFPDIAVPYDVLGQIIAYLTETRVNAQVLPKVIRGIHNITIGTGVGQVVVHVHEQKVNVSTRETDEEIGAKI